MGCVDGFEYFYIMRIGFGYVGFVAYLFDDIILMGTRHKQYANSFLHSHMVT